MQAKAISQAAATWTAVLTDCASTGSRCPEPSPWLDARGRAWHMVGSLPISIRHPRHVPVLSRVGWLTARGATEKLKIQENTMMAAAIPAAGQAELFAVILSL